MKRLFTILLSYTNPFKVRMFTGNNIALPESMSMHIVNPSCLNHVHISYINDIPIIKHDLLSDDIFANNIIASTDTSIISEFENEFPVYPIPASFVVSFIYNYKKHIFNKYVIIDMEKYNQFTDNSNYEVKLNHLGNIDISFAKINFTLEELMEIHKANCNRLTNSYISDDIIWIEQFL